MSDKGKIKIGSKILWLLAEARDDSYVSTTKEGFVLEVDYSNEKAKILFLNENKSCWKPFKELSFGKQIKI